MNAFASTLVLEHQLLLQLGDRLKHLRKTQGIGTVEMAQRVGISRTTLSAIESGDPGAAIGSYVKVMSVLGICGDLALLASDVLRPAPADSAGARSRRSRPVVHLWVSAAESHHQIQDLQSLALHEAAVQLVRANPDLKQQAEETLERWLQSSNMRSSSLWREWKAILATNAWRKALARTPRAQQLRQASPLPTVLPEQMRRDILDQVRQLKAGRDLG